MSHFPPPEPSPNDRFGDVPGLSVGHAHDSAIRSGTTVIVPHAPVIMAVDVRGGGPCTRETEALSPHNLVERVHALVLSGGSVFGLAAADAVVFELSQRGIGLAAGARAVPVVPAAGLFDLNNGGDKAWAANPYPALGLAALAALGNDASGAVGAGHSATAGSRAGGIGSVALCWNGYTLGALVAVNSYGEVYAGAPPEGDVPLPKHAVGRALSAPFNTCIGAFATDAPLTRAQAQRVAVMAQDGLARAVRPIHTPFDGDSIFVLSTAAPGTPPVDAVTLAVLGTLAADLVARATRRGVFG
jgi:L-aminopeptidase/D-esterase-like protein